MRKGLLFVVSGPSGAGKGTICKELLKRLDIDLSVSMTTRPPRIGEIEGESYYFVSEVEFLRTKENGGLLECACVYGNYYGTPKQMVLEKLAAGRDVILEIDIQGALAVREVYPEGVFIFILPPTLAELRKRITERGTDTQEVIARRMSETLKEISCIDKYDYFVVNGELSEATERVEAIMAAEHCRVSEDIYQLIEEYKEEL